MGSVVVISDLDECVTGSYACDLNAVCQNTVGSYTCSCKAGYTGDEETCQGEMFTITKAMHRVNDLLTCKWDQLSDRSGMNE